MGYDEIAVFYLDFVRKSLENELSPLTIAQNELLRMLGDVHGLSICDIACGTGHLTAKIAETAEKVVGTDFSGALLDIARSHYIKSNLSFVHDDAQMLKNHGDGIYDCAVCCFALMDISDLQAVFQSVYRVLRPQGRFIFTITHPCFQSPHAYDDTTGDLRCISQYASEGAWFSSNKRGVRGQMGAYHRTLSSYLNGLISTGFVLDTLSEPTVQSEIPTVLVVSAMKMD